MKPALQDQTGKARLLQYPFDDSDCLWEAAKQGMKATPISLPRIWYFEIDCL